MTRLEGSGLRVEVKDKAFQLGDKGLGPGVGGWGGEGHGELGRLTRRERRSLLHSMTKG